MKKVIIFFCLLTIIGCARSQKYWINPTVTKQEDANKDFRECIYEGQKMKLTVEGSGKGLQGYNDGNYAQIVTTNNCMQARGYYLSDTPPAIK